MVVAFQWMVRLFIAGAALGLIALLVVYYLASGSLPEYNRVVSVQQLSEDVEIIRDEYAVPHILGNTDEDVLFGLGFAHAQDRLWQMTMLRRTAQGRLSELFGPDTFDIDHLMRAIDLYGVAQAQVPYQTPEVQRLLQAYSNGVNARIRQIGQEALGRGAPEFFLFGGAISPWTPADSMAVKLIMSLQTTAHPGLETLYAELSLRLSQKQMQDILPTPPFLKALEAPDLGYLDGAPGSGNMPKPATRYAGLSPTRPIGFTGASNAWAAAPERSATGTSLLASDPHLAFAAPSIWMLARLELPGTGGVIGGSIPGLPGILIGRNQYFGWGVTTAYTDDADIFIERIDPENPDAYITPQGSVPFETRDVLIGVGEDSPARTIRLLRTRHGPVLPASAWNVGGITPPGHVAALSWVALTAEDPGMGSLIELMRARTTEDGRRAIEPLIAPSQNIIMADASTIAHYVMGRQPHRRATHMGRGQLPVPGWVSDNDWLGLLPFADNPSDVAPESGLVINTNNRTTDAPYPRHLSYSWGDSKRILRARRLLGERAFHTVESFQEAQTDIISPAARSLLPLIGRDLFFTESATATDPLARLRRLALARLADWNGEMSEHRPEPLIYASWAAALQKRLIQDEIGPLTEKLTKLDPLLIESIFRNIDGAGIWCDVTTSSVVESCTDMARLALNDAIADLQQRYGSRLEAWRWGDAHQALHQHQVLTHVPGVSYLANIIQPTSGGDATLMRGLMAGQGENPFANVHGSGLRVLYDFGDPEGSQMIISTGQSGHLLSEHYDDLSILWRRGKYIPMSLDLDRARAGTIGITRLVPQ